MTVTYPEDQLPPVNVQQAVSGEFLDFNFACAEE